MIAEGSLGETVAACFLPPGPVTLPTYPGLYVFIDNNDCCFKLSCLFFRTLSVFECLATCTPFLHPQTGVALNSDHAL